MSKPVLYLFNGKVARFGSGVLGFTPPPPVVPVQIGDQIWSNKNLSINDGGEGISTRTVNYGQGDVVETYYTFDAAVRVGSSVPGWHLPTKQEWTALNTYVGSNNYRKLMSTYGWEGTYGGSTEQGTDEYGFAAFPSLWSRATSSNYRNAAYFWSSTSTSSYAFNFGLLADGFMFSDYGSFSLEYSVRLIKDS